MAREVRRRTPEPTRPNRLKLWLRRRRGLLRPIAFGAVGLAAVGALALMVRAIDPVGRLEILLEDTIALGRDAGLEVREVIVEGRQNTPLELVRAAIGVGRSDPMLGFSPQEAKERLEMLTWVLHAHVERHLPGTILVRLEEREPFAIWQNQGRFSVIDREGQVLATAGLDSFGPLPLVVGVGAERHAAALHEMLLDYPDILARTQALVRVSERRWNLRLHNGTDVLLPEGHEAAALERLAELQQMQALLDRPLAAVDMRLPDRLVLRQPPQPEATPASTSTGRRSAGSGRG